MTNIIIKGEIATKQRPRATIIGGHARMYTPKNTISYENYVRSEYQRQNGEFFEDKPLDVRIIAHYKAPNDIISVDHFQSSACVKNKDLDNTAKIILDSLNNIAYYDDKQVVSLSISKQWDLEEYVEVSIRKSNIPSLEIVKLKNKFADTLSKKSELLIKLNGKKPTKAENERLERYSQQIEELKGKLGDGTGIL